MADKALQVEAAEFFDAFVEAFRSFDGNEIAGRYVAPYIALREDGVVGSLLTHADVARYFQSVADDYFAKGCRSCRYKELEVVPIGSQSAMGTVTWELLRQDGGVLKVWRESYNFARTENGLRIFASTDHVE